MGWLENLASGKMPQRRQEGPWWDYILLAFLIGLIALWWRFG